MICLKFYLWLTAKFFIYYSTCFRDRMEIIEINGYTIEEKIEIAQKTFTSKTNKRTWIKKKDILLSKEKIDRKNNRWIY